MVLPELRKFVSPEFIFGIGARNLASRYAVNYHAKKVLVVTDPGVISAGWVQPIIDDLHRSGIPSVIFADVHSNPRDFEVTAGVEVFQKENCNMIIAIGGGSPMDCAKGIGIVDSNHKNVLAFEGVDEVSVPAPPLVCIPTTAGTSADVSQFAIINDTTRKIKIAIISKTVVPDAALIDPQTTTSMDAELTAATGLDALTHAVEAYVSNAQSPITDLHALEAVRLVRENLLSALREPENLEFRTNMMLASLHAGLAFSNASLGIVHAMAHCLGGLLDLPHGECNAPLLEHAVSYNYSAVAERYDRIAEAMGIDLTGLVTEERQVTLVRALKALREAAGISSGLAEIGVRKEDIPRLAANALKDPCLVTNPREATLADIEAIYHDAL